MHLSGPVLRKLIEEQKVVTDYDNLDKQLTANGIDVRLAAVVEVLDGGKLAVEKKECRNPKLGRAVVLQGFENSLDGNEVTEKVVAAGGTIKLDKLKPYLVITCERVNTPTNLTFHILSRSSLFRLTQSLLGYGLGEAGYKGFLTFLLFPVIDSEIELGSRIAQLSFSELRGEGNYEQQKETNYQGGKLF